MRKFGLVAAVLVAGLMVSQSFGAATIFLSTSPLPPVGQNGPVPEVPDITLNAIGESVTLYLWAQLATANTQAFGMDFVETSPAVVTGSNVVLVNPDIGDVVDPETSEFLYDIMRWNGWNQKVGMANGDVGFAAVGKFNDADSGGYYAIGLTSAVPLGGSDPTRRGPTPYKFYVGQVTFTAAAVGQTDIFLTVNDTLMIGSAGMIGTTAAPVLLLGGGDATPVPVSFDAGTSVYYIASGGKSLLADAKITVVPEPATLALLGLAGLVLVRRR